MMHFSRLAPVSARAFVRAVILLVILSSLGVRSGAARAESVRLADFVPVVPGLDVDAPPPTHQTPGELPEALLKIARERVAQYERQPKWFKKLLATELIVNIFHMLDDFKDEVSLLCACAELLRTNLMSTPIFREFLDLHKDFIFHKQSRA